MSSAPPPEPGGSLRTSLLIGVVCLLVYNANLRSISAGDTYPARYQPFGILRHGSLTLEPILSLVRQGRSPAEAYWIRPGRDGRTVSLYPVVLPVLVSPLYVPAAIYLRSQGWPQETVERAAMIMEKLTASLLTAASAALLFLLLRRRASPRLSLLLTLVYAFGTTTWVISSQALWQHGLAELLLVSALLLVTGPATPARVIATGAILALIAANRPPDALLAAAIGFPALFWARRRAPLLVAAALIPAGLVLAYNLALAGHWAGGYGVAARAGNYGMTGSRRFFRNDLLVGLAGLLFSPARGLFVFSPFLLLVPLAFRRVWADAGDRRLTAALGIAVALQLLLYAKADWVRVASWGPRWLTDLLPVLFWMLAPAVASLRGASRLAFACACGAAVLIEAIGAFWYMNVSDDAIMTATSPSQATWEVRNAPFLMELRHPPAPTVLWAPGYRCDATDARGNLDLLAGRAESGEIPAREELRAEGWTLVEGRSPWSVAVTLDGRTVGSTSRFFTRPDVVRALGSASPSGWAIPIRAAALAPGPHLLRVVARSCPSGAPREVVTRRIVAAETPAPASSGSTAGLRPCPSDLPAVARRAAARLEQHQSPEGYWLTSYTSATRFERPSREMNTFLTATLVDLLGPVAAEAGLDAAVGRARRHLSAQIESGGLVRYHGLPDGPTIGWLGCLISPDADDTALVWRVAPGPRPELLGSALATLGEYRSPEGLYKTWLVPRDRYQCLDPGNDPNPTDVGIQMHVLLLLAQADPAASRALCSALSGVIDEDRVWVYYRMAPTVPILRQADLEKAGCPLDLPAARLRTSVPGQDDWVAAAKLLRCFAGRNQTPPDPEQTLALLGRLAADDLAFVRTSPPLVYHNDLTASVPRFYWSEDFGYALWLRLFHEHLRRHPASRGRGLKS
ncbi:MAG TPA: hypothetical protein VMX54_10015 [Vicinamibacteria bacterium]|nr:hypothetical protein [Vicinamibacteria bacterium]